MVIAAIFSAIAVFLRPGGVKGLVAENLLLKQQLLIIKRSRRRAPNLLSVDRFLFGLWSLFLNPSRISKVAVIIRPSTILSFHRALVRRKYRILFSSKTRRKPGPKGPSEEVIRVIVEIKQRNPRFGCPRIALIIAKTFGVEIDKDVVRRVLAKRYRPTGGGRGPSWLTFLGHTKDSLWSIDLFRLESVVLRTHWVLVVMDQFSRSIIGFGVQRGSVDGATLCRMFNDAVAGRDLPRRLSSDNDPLFEYHRWKAHLRVLEIKEIKSVPCVPASHPFIERVIGTTRGECLDQILFWNSVDLTRKLSAFQIYYNEMRVHQGLGGAIPAEIAEELTTQPANLDHFAWKSANSGLVQLPTAA